MFNKITAIFLNNEKNANKLSEHIANVTIKSQDPQCKRQSGNVEGIILQKTIGKR